MSAIISDCGLYRYRLERTIALEGITVAWFGVNPSTASAELDDPTIRKMVGFSRKLGAKTMIVGNCIPYRTANVHRIGRTSDAAWIENRKHCSSIIREAAVVIPCWGDVSKKLPEHLRCHPEHLEWLIRQSGAQALCLGKTKAGDPRHPLMLGYNTPFERF